MKKATKLFLAAAVLFCTVFMLGGCELMDRVGELVEPKKQWREYDYHFSYNNTDYLVECYMFYSDTDYNDANMKNNSANGNSEDSTLPAGLTIVAKPNADLAKDASAMKAIFGQAINSGFVIKTFKNGDKVEISDKKDSDGTNEKKFTMGYTTWAIIYNSIHTTSSTIPSELKNGNGVPEISLETAFWKKIMYAMAIDKLIELSAE